MEIGALPTILIFQNSGQDSIAEYLRFNGFQVIETNEQDVAQKLKEAEYQLCVLDCYRGPNELRLLNIVKKFDESKPVIMVTDSTEYGFIIKAFREGADDYVSKPCNVEELVCRIKAVLRRCRIDSRAVGNVYEIGGLTLNVKEQILYRGRDFAVTLNMRESRTLAVLCAYRNETVPAVFLLKKIWYDDNKFNKRSLDVHICRLRKYLAIAPNIRIETIRGFGYCLKEF